jgi:hypothetical protein|tara:strand:- start:58 stop:327 length:270 start_codon:yes stop_codon:yes gene_type:complete
MSVSDKAWDIMEQYNDEFSELWNRLNNELTAAAVGKTVEFVAPNGKPTSGEIIEAYCSSIMNDLIEFIVRYDGDRTIRLLPHNILGEAT